MNPVACPVCAAAMIHICAADHRCEACGYEYVADWDKMTLIDAAMVRMSAETRGSFPGFVPHLVDLCSGAYWPDDDEMSDCDGIAIAGLPESVSPLDIVVWNHWRRYLSELSEQFLADEVGIDLAAA